MRKGLAKLLWIHREHRQEVRRQISENCQERFGYCRANGALELRNCEVHVAFGEDLAKARAALILLGRRRLRSVS
jgi:hypothetical protein